MNHNKDLFEVYIDVLINIIENIQLNLKVPRTSHSPKINIILTMILKMMIFSLFYQTVMDYHERDPREVFVSHLQATLLKQNIFERITC